MGNVISFIPSRTGIAIGRLLNAKLRHMLALSLRAARRHTSFFLATDTMSVSGIIQFGFTKFV